MNENGQNGPKVFASIAKFGETKFKPIRIVQENHNNLNNDKQNRPAESTGGGGGRQHASSRAVAENQPQQQQPSQAAPAAKSRVNKFFKSRNPVSVLEETNSKPKPANKVV